MMSNILDRMVMILEENAKSIQLLTKCFQNSSQIKESSRGNSLSSRNSCTPVPGYTTACYVCRYYGHGMKICPNIWPDYLNSCCKCWSTGHEADTCVNPS